VSKTEVSQPASRVLNIFNIVRSAAAEGEEGHRDLNPGSLNPIQETGSSRPLLFLHLAVWARPHTSLAVSSLARQHRASAPYSRG
jgi:hypothetical protein